jgi:lipoic acid synthetase
MMGNRHSGRPSGDGRSGDGRSGDGRSGGWHSSEPVKGRRFPPWLRKALPRSGSGRRVKGILDELALNTVCEEAKCPNRAECYERGTATFLILGPVCTRNCRFCGIAKGKPGPLEENEPERVARAVRALGLDYVVITSVTRDELPDGGAGHFAETIRAVRRITAARIEVLTPDFGGSGEALDTVLEAAPDVFNHNVEVVPRLYPRVRPEADYRRSLGMLKRAKELQPGLVTKSGLMLGLGERRGEVLNVLRDLREVRCDLVTIGQYLQPAPESLPVAEYVPPEVFRDLEEEGRAAGFLQVVAGPFVRSSYRAREVFPGE